MPIPRKRPGRPGRERKPAGRMKPENPLQKELSRKTAKLQLFLVEQMPSLPIQKRAALLSALKERRVLQENQGLQDLHGIIARAVILSSEMRQGKKPKSEIGAAKQGFLVTKVRSAFAAISELK